jgi:hypothetical protein
MNRPVGIWCLCLLLAACGAEPSSAIGTVDDETDGRVRPGADEDADDSGANGGADSDVFDGPGDTDDSGPTADADSGRADTSDGNQAGDVDAGPVDANDAGGNSDAVDSEESGAGGDTGEGADGSGSADASDGSGSDGDGGGSGFGVCGEDYAVADVATLPVDIVWIVDGSPSMDDSIANIEANLNAFTARIAASGLDYRVVMVGADREYCFDARCYNEICVPPPLSAAAGCPDTDSPRYLHVRQGVHSSDAIDLSIEYFSSYRSFLRSGSVVHFVFVTDDDAGFGPGREEFQALLDSSIRPTANEVHVHSIVDLVDSPSGCGVFGDDCSCGDERGDEYIALSEATDGLVQSVCAADWAPIFDALEERVVEGTALPCNYALPEVDITLAVDRVNVVLVDGEERTPVPNVTNGAGCASGDGWYFDDQVSPTGVILCPAACLGATGSIELEFGCSTIKI